MRRCRRSGEPVRNACSARLQRRHTRDVALGEPRRQTVEQDIDRPALGPRRRGPSGLGHLPSPLTAVQAAGEDRRSERLEVRLTRLPVAESVRVGSAASISSGTASRPRLRAKTIRARSRASRARCSSSSGPSSAAARSSDAAVRRTRPRSWRVLRSSPELLGRQHRASARWRASERRPPPRAPPRAWARSAERSSSLGHGLVGFHRRVGAMPRPAIRVGSGSVASASARCTSCRSPGPPRGTPPTAPADDGTAPASTELDQSRRLGRGRVRLDGRAGRPHASTTPHPPPARRRPPAAASGSGPGATAMRRRKLCSI